MAKVLGRLMLIVVPVLLILGLIRYSVRNFEGSFLPSYIEITGWFSTFPDAIGQYRDALSWFNETAAGAQVCLPDLTNPFNIRMQCWSNPFFNYVVGVAQIAWITLKTPFEVLGWFFTNFFGM